MSSEPTAILASVEGIAAGIREAFSDYSRSLATDVTVIPHHGGNGSSQHESHQLRILDGYTPSSLPLFNISGHGPRWPR